jgi:flagellin
MTVISTNTAANITANALTKNERAMSQAMERLSTGQRINNAGDDAAGLAISSRMTSQINGLNMAVRNANDAVSMVTTADGAYIEATAMMQRMRELAVQAASGTMSSTDRTALNTEYQALNDQILEIAGNTQWNGTNILDDTVGTTGSVDFHVGANASQTITTDFGSLGYTGRTATASVTAADTGNSVAAFVEFTVAGGALVDGDQISMFFGDEGGWLTITLGSGDAAHITAGTAMDSPPTLVFETTGQNYDATATATGFFSSTGAGNAAGNLSIAAGSAANKFKLTGSNTASASTIVAPTDIHITRGISAGIIATNITAVDHANAAIAKLDTAIASMNTQRATFGSAINRLEYAADNLSNVAQNTAASRSRVLDADYASETTELARTQIIQQAATAMLSQDNQQAQSVLALLK